mmetsp:Transcript_24374/g.96687  ORF Transcript_24374/g.96687 Transcript_24374/m.96687 type:complete len:283 (-) Transcript_24374:760-1608(-)
MLKWQDPTPHTSKTPLVDLALEIVVVRAWRWWCRGAAARRRRRGIPRRRCRGFDGDEVGLADGAEVLVGGLEPRREAGPVELVVARRALDVRQSFGFGVQHPEAHGARLDIFELEIHRGPPSPHGVHGGPRALGARPELQRPALRLGALHALVRAELDRDAPQRVARLVRDGHLDDALVASIPRRHAPRDLRHRDLELAVFFRPIVVLLRRRHAGDGLELRVDGGAPEDVLGEVSRGVAIFGFAPRAPRPREPRASYERAERHVRTKYSVSSLDVVAVRGAP